MSLSFNLPGHGLDKALIWEDRRQGKWTDAVLLGEDGPGIQVHRIVLAASSSFLGELLKGAEEGLDGEPVTIALPDIPGWVVELLVQLMYGDLALDCWAPGNELIVEAAQQLGLVEMAREGQEYQPLPSSAEELLASFSDQDIIKEVERIAMDGFVVDRCADDIPMDILEYFNELEEDKIDYFIEAEDDHNLGDCHSQEVPKESTGTIENISEQNRDRILNCSYISMQRRQLILSLLTCKKCSQVSRGLSDIETHKCLPEEAVEINCIFKCPKSFEDFRTLYHHLNQTHRLNVGNMLAKIELDATQRKQSKSDLECRLCGVKEESSGGLINHFKKEHPEDLPWQCEVCGQQTADGARMRRHMICHQKQDNREICDICNKEFRNKVSLRTHRNMVHKLGKKYTCAFCGKVLYSSQYLKKHEATHTGEKFKAVVCKHCGKSVEYTKLKNHELTHTGEKPFKCSECDYRCIQRSNLRIHMKGVHKKELPRLAVGQKRYSGVFMDGTAGNNDPFDLRSVFHAQKGEKCHEA